MWVELGTLMIPTMDGMIQFRVIPTWRPTIDGSSACGLPASGDQPHVGIAGVTLHKTRHIRIIEDTNRCSYRLLTRGITSRGLARPSPLLT